MKAILISDKPKWCALMMNGDKTIEVRKNKALAKAIQKLIDENGYADIYVYCTKDKKNLLHKNCANIYWIEDKYFRNKNKQLGLQTQPILNGKVLFKFVCSKVEQIEPFEEFDSPMGLGYKLTAKKIITCQKAQLTYDEYNHYLKGKTGYAVHISQLEIFDRPKELSKFYKKGATDYINNCPKRLQFRCNGRGSGLKTINCIKKDDMRLTKAPQSYCFIEVEE